jgi:hypothetical protein
MAKNGSAVLLARKGHCPLEGKRNILDLCLEAGFRWERIDRRRPRRPSRTSKTRSEVSWRNHSPYVNDLLLRASMRETGLCGVGIETRYGFQSKEVMSFSGRRGMV